MLKLKTNGIISYSVNSAASELLLLLCCSNYACATSMLIICHLSANITLQYDVIMSSQCSSVSMAHSEVIQRENYLCW